MQNAVTQAKLMRVPRQIFIWLSSLKARMLNHQHPPGHINSLIWSWRRSLLPLEDYSDVAVSLQGRELSVTCQSVDHDMHPGCSML